MCNPRRIRVRATRQLDQAWQDEVRRQVTRAAEVSGEARVREPLGTMLGAPTLTALGAALDRAPGWEWDGQRFSHALDGGRITFDPVSHDLEIVAELSDRVEVTGESSAVVGGTLTTSVEAEGEGTYYDDGWGGYTADTARADAERSAEAALDDAVTQALAQSRDEAETREGDRVEQAAAADAARALDQAVAARRRQLRQQATARLEAVGVQGRNLFHAALAEAYRDAILAYARARGAAGIRCSDSDGVVEIEFEMPA
jgi:hypothetical protein